MHRPRLAQPRLVPCSWCRLRDLRAADHPPETPPTPPVATTSAENGVVEGNIPNNRESKFHATQCCAGKRMSQLFQSGLDSGGHHHCCFATALIQPRQRRMAPDLVVKPKEVRSAGYKARCYLGVLWITHIGCFQCEIRNDKNNGCVF